jgi:hypothetical protein
VFELPILFSPGNDLLPFNILTIHSLTVLQLNPNSLAIVDYEIPSFLKYNIENNS